MGLTNLGAGLCLSGPGLVAADRWFSLFLGDPEGVGVEVAAAGYARLARTPAQLVVANNVFSVTAGEWDDSADVSWGVPTHVGIHTDLDGADSLVFGQIIDPVLSEIIAGTRVFAGAGDLTFTLALA